MRWRADGTPERWTLLKRDACRDLAAYARAGGHRPSRAQVVAVHVLTHEASTYPAMPDGYRSSTCRPGGGMDEHLPDAPWTPTGA